MLTIYTVAFLLGLGIHDWVVFKVRTPKELLASLFCNGIVTAVVFGVLYGTSILVEQNGWYFAVIPVVLSLLMIVGTIQLTTMLLQYLLSYIHGATQK